MDWGGQEGDKEGSYEAAAMIYIRNDGGWIRIAAMQTEVDIFS